jgi:hypothetical protein
MAGPSTEEIAATVRRSKRAVLWNRLKWGTLVGVVGGLVAAGYQQRAIEAYLASAEAQKVAAEALEKSYDSRTVLQKMFGRGEKPPVVTVGKNFFGQRDAKGRTLDIGRKEVWKNAPRFMRGSPTIPLNKRGAKGAAIGGLAGAGLVLGAGAMKRGFQRMRRGRRGG